MDDNAIQNSKVNPPVGGQNASGQDISVVQPVASPAAPFAPVSKEQAPIPTKPMTEYATDQEPVLVREVAEVGVETKEERAHISEEVAKAGLQHAKESVPVPASPSQVQWPITPEKAQAVLKAPHKAIKDSVVWLATLVAKMVKKQEQKPAEGGNV